MVVEAVTGAGWVEVVAVAVVEVVSTLAGTGFFIRSGKSFGATAAYLLARRSAFVTVWPRLPAS